MSVEIIVPDSVKAALAAQYSGDLSVPVSASADVVVSPVASLLSPATGFRYHLSHVPFAPEAIPSIAPSNLTDDGYLDHVPLGFTFNFYGNDYSEVAVYSNGLVMFGPAVRDPLGFYRGDLIPYAANPNNIIAFAWTDWQPNKVPGSIRYETRGTEPNRRFLLQFTNVPEYGGRGLLMMQLVLAEGSNDITIYTNTMSITNSGNRVTQGVENANGTAAAFDSVTNPVNGVVSPRVKGFFSLSTDAIRFAPPHPPVVTPPANISVATAPPATSGDNRVESCAAVVDPGVATATSDASIVSVAGVRSDGLALDAAYPKGVTTITWTATDADGMTANAVQTITVVDKENPSITAPHNISVGNDPHLPSAVVVVGSAEAADNCPDVKISSVRSDGAASDAPFRVGVTTVTWTATDASGNTASAPQLITVNDIEPPSIAPLANITVNATSTRGAVVIYHVDASDNVGVVSIDCTRASGSVFPVGSTSVECTAADAAGNRETASFVVSVLNAQAQMQNLIDYILGLGLPNGTTNPLVNQLYTALDASRSDSHVACVKMDDFLGLVGKKSSDIRFEESAYMTSEATRICAVLGCAMPGGHPRLLTPDASNY
ncbi:MAG TPA: HYR domain-containing protein [Gemmatimonadaceae bacterium]